MGLRYLVVIEKSPHNYGAYVPDVPGCITTGKTVSETLDNMQEALTGHLELMKEDGDPIPFPTTQAVPTLGTQDTIGYVDVNVDIPQAS